MLDGEAIALRADGRPHPFQVTGVALREPRRPRARVVPLTPLFFDVLHLDGEDLLDRPGARARRRRSPALVPEARVPRVVTADAGAAEAFSSDALARGHEGVVVKALDAPVRGGPARRRRG